MRLLPNNDAWKRRWIVAQSITVVFTANIAIVLVRCNELVCQIILAIPIFSIFICGTFGTVAA